MICQLQTYCISESNYVEEMLNAGVGLLVPAMVNEKITFFSLDLEEAGFEYFWDLFNGLLAYCADGVLREVKLDGGWIPPK